MANTSSNIIECTASSFENNLHVDDDRLLARGDTTQEKHISDGSRCTLVTKNKVSLNLRF
jgi:hypothetical protein